MSCMRCPRCGLSVHQRFPLVALQYCPRCIARRREAVLMEAPDPPAPGRDVDTSRTERCPIRRIPIDLLDIPDDIADDGGGV